eukprot:TRINITY_DN11194_c0_g2_i5.p1 TRINITY_DN11194_c0_g2~~TRINITY_DN11194_c0_g2_i5.p1  ORF type:complete len:631 (-),score=227.46 TRINITY_DN11194_c0_g2_i5:70-1962(-)
MWRPGNGAKKNVPTTDACYMYSPTTGTIKFFGLASAFAADAHSSTDDAIALLQKHVSNVNAETPSQNVQKLIDMIDKIIARLSQANQLDASKFQTNYGPNSAFQQQLTNLRNTATTLERQIEENKNLQKQKQAEISSLNDAIAVAIRTVTDLENQVKTAQDNVAVAANKLRTAIENFDSEIAETVEFIKFLTDVRDQLTQVTYLEEGSDAHKEQATEAVEALAKKVETVQSENLKSMAEMASAAASMVATGTLSQRDVDDLRGMLQTIIDELNKYLQQKRDEKASTVTVLTSSLKSAQTTLVNVGDRLSATQQDKSRNERRLSDAQSALASAQTFGRSLEASLTNTGNEIKNREATIANAQKSLDNDTAARNRQIELLRALRAQLDNHSMRDHLRIRVDNIHLGGGSNADPARPEGSHADNARPEGSHADPIRPEDFTYEGGCDATGWTSRDHPEWYRLGGCANCLAVCPNNNVLRGFQVHRCGNNPLALSIRQTCSAADVQLTKIFDVDMCASDAKSYSWARRDYDILYDVNLCPQGAVMLGWGMTNCDTSFNRRLKIRCGQLAKYDWTAKTTEVLGECGAGTYLNFDSMPGVSCPEGFFAYGIGVRTCPGSTLRLSVKCINLNQLLKQ